MSLRAARRALTIAALATLLGACGGAEGPPTTPPAAAMHELRVTVAGDGRGNVRLAPVGMDCTSGASSCASSMAAGTVATLTAIPDEGSTFAGWTGTECGSASTCALRVDGARAVTATFARVPTYTLGVSTAGAGAGTVSSTPAGIACVRETGGRQAGACELSLVASTSVTLSAAPAAGSRFDGWSGAGAAGCVGTGVCTTVLYEARAVVATFSLVPVDLTIETAGAGTGDVTSAPTGVDCRRGADGATSGACVLSLAPGTNVTLVATPTGGSLFAGWSGSGASDCGAAPTCVVTMAEARAATARFDPAPVTLDVVLAGDGAGSVGASAHELACVRTTGSAVQSGSCRVAVPPGTAVTLVASPAAGSAFAGWSGGGCGAGPTCVVTPRQATTVTATFAPTGRVLRLALAGTGGGTVTSAPAGIACTHAAGTADGAATGLCASTFPAGATVTLTATPASGSTFQGWTGACSGTGSCVTTLSAAREVTATFVANVTLGVFTSGSGAGDVTSSPAGIACTHTNGARAGSCVAPFATGTLVSLTASPAAGATFAGWTGEDCSGVGPCLVRMTVSRTVIANFLGTTVPLTVTTTGSGGGTVSSTPAGIVCTRANGGQSGGCNGTYAPGTVVTLTATPAAGSTFLGWTGSCTGTGAACTVTLTPARAVTAIFSQATVPLTIGFGGTGAGVVSSDLPGIACTVASSIVGGTCVAPFDLGSSVTLAATAFVGHIFTGWSGACTGTARTCVVSMTGARSATALFRADVNPPGLLVRGVTNGATYSVHPSISFVASDDVALGEPTWLRITWRVRLANGTVLCARGGISGVTGFDSEANFPCFTLGLGVESLPQPSYVGQYTLTVQSVDMAGNVSPAITRTYTVGM